MENMKCIKLIKASKGHEIGEVLRVDDHDADLRVKGGYWSFDGTDDYLPLDGSSLANTNYTTFVVVQRRSDSLANYIYGGTGSTEQSSVIAGYSANTIIRFSHVGTNNGLSTAISSYSSPIPQIHTFWFSQTDGKKYWLNGGITTDGSSSDSTQKLPASSNVGFAIGRYDGSNTNLTS
jgi:hypothetical protein